MKNSASYHLQAETDNPHYYTLDWIAWSREINISRRHHTAKSCLWRVRFCSLWASVAENEPLSASLFHFLQLKRSSEGKTSPISLYDTVVATVHSMLFKHNSKCVYTYSVSILISHLTRYPSATLHQLHQALLDSSTKAINYDFFCAKNSLMMTCPPYSMWMTWCSIIVCGQSLQSKGDKCQ